MFSCTNQRVSQPSSTNKYLSDFSAYLAQGQIRRVGELFYSTKVDIFVVGQHFNKDDNTTHVTFRLLFDNVAFKDTRKAYEDSVVDNIPLR